MGTCKDCIHYQPNCDEPLLGKCAKWKVSTAIDTLGYMTVSTGDGVPLGITGTFGCMGFLGKVDRAEEITRAELDSLIDWQKNA